MIDQNPAWIETEISVERKPEDQELFPRKLLAHMQVCLRSLGGLV